MTFVELLSKYEWYDNTRLSIIRGCKRKAFFQLIGPLGKPLAQTVGDGANFGTAFHAATNKYYSLWGKANQFDRQGEAALTFRDEWQNFFPTARMQPKHSFENGLAILANYFDTHLAEDEHYRPIKGELGFCSIIQVPDDLPLLFLGRIDGIFERVYDKKIFVRELKTTSGSTKDRLEALKFSHQTLGYVQSLREGLPSLKIVGAMPDVVLVAAQKREALRTCYSIDQADGLSWKTQLIETIIDWRRMKRRAQDVLDIREQNGKIVINFSKFALDVFTQDTERCFDYGKCSFYDICDYGVGDGAILDNFEENTWNPITSGHAVDLEVFDVPSNI